MEKLLPCHLFPLLLQWVDARWESVNCVGHEYYLVFHCQMYVFIYIYTCIFYALLPRISLHYCLFVCEVLFVYLSSIYYNYDVPVGFIYDFTVFFVPCIFMLSLYIYALLPKLYRFLFISQKSWKFTCDYFHNRCWIVHASREIVVHYIGEKN